MNFKGDCMGETFRMKEGCSAIARIHSLHCSSPADAGGRGFLSRLMCPVRPAISAEAGILGNPSQTHETLDSDFRRNDGVP
jgi:hypothetical protein